MIKYHFNQTSFEFMKHISLTFILIVSLCSPAQAELNDQGLISIISIIDKAITAANAPADPKAESNSETKTDKQDTKKSAGLSNSTLVNMARTLGKLSFSRLQCGEASVLGEFTKRVQSSPEAYQNLMRSAFQEGFDKSKNDTKLLSDDECKRLTQSRQIKAVEAEANVEAPKEAAAKKPEKKPEPKEDPALKHLRLAHMVGQLAYKKKLCGDKKIFTSDFNEIIENMPENTQKKAKAAYWKGYKQGRKMNKNLEPSQC